MATRAFIGPSYSSDIPTEKKIPAADGILGVIILLSYYGGGTNFFPESVPVKFFIHTVEKFGYVRTDVELLFDLVEEMSKYIQRDIGTLSISSLRPYLSSLRKGKRPNVNGRVHPLPPVNVTFFEKDKDQKLVIAPRRYQDDLAAGMTHFLPEGFGNIIENFA